MPTTAALAGLDASKVTIVNVFESTSERHSVLINGPVETYLPLEELVDPKVEQARLEKELKEAQSHIERLEKLLAGDFANKAPAQLVQKERDKLEGYKETADKIRAQLQ